MIVNGTIETFDKVIIATALHKDNDIKFYNKELELLKTKYEY